MFCSVLNILMDSGEIGNEILTVRELWKPTNTIQQEKLENSSMPNSES